MFRIMTVSNKRRVVLRSIGAAGLGLLAGCTGGGDDGGTDGTGSNDDSADTAAKNIAIVFATGGLGDLGFNDLAHAGIQRAESELGIQYDMAEPDDNTQFEQYQRRFAQSTDPDYDLICCIGFAQAPTLSEIAPEFPEQNFMIIDSVVEASNVASYTFKEHEGSYLLGVAAGNLTSREFTAGGGSTNPGSNRLGFVGGVESFLINKFLAGYQAGALSVDPDIEVRSSYVGSFSDPATAKESAKGMYANDVDLIFPAAGGSGVGVFQAAMEDERLAFGVDTPQSETQPQFAEVILGSMVKKTDSAVYRAIESEVDDALPMGEASTLGVAEEGVAFVLGEAIGDAIPSDVLDAVDEAKESIINAEIEVPDEI
jgi:basic membrane protein A